MTFIGTSSLVIALLFCIYALICLVVGIENKNSKLLLSGRGATLSVAFLSIVASLILIYFLITGNYQIKYVYQYTNKDLPIFYKFAAFWAGNAGSLMLWTLLLTIYTAVIAFPLKRVFNKYLAYAVIVLLMINIFFLSVLIFITNPFELLPVKPADGNGLNPLLQNPGMVFHPLTLYLGYVGFTVPFAFAMSALITKKVDDWWIKTTRRWTVWAWLFLSLGNLFGAQWAYVELGWGGYWAWDPVENSSFMPWLTATAFVHSIIIQERKNMLKIWNMFLIIATYLLTIFGTFLTRSGVYASVHSFSDSSLGSVFLSYIILLAALSLGLIFHRLKLLKEQRSFESYISKESSFLFNNLLLVGGAFAVFWGTNFPIISEAIRGVKVTVSVPWYNQVMSPILLGVILLIGICPLIAWHKSSYENFKNNFLIPTILSIIFAVIGYYFIFSKKLYATIGFTISFFALITTIQEFVKGVRVRRKVVNEGYLVSLWRLISKNRRRYGGYIVHIGTILIAVGIIGSNAYKIEKEVRVKLGDEIAINDYTMKYKGLEMTKEGSNQIVFAKLKVKKNGKSIGILKPEKVFYKTWDQPSTEVAIYSTLKEDLYVALAGWINNGKYVDLMIHINPLVIWIWIGGYILIIGSIIALWPGKGAQLNPKYIL
ncbi:heme lyase CcmF/NrfE family subunit [Deferribacter autotrophicus]|uniref:Heme lyase CcmF/NrfE family subunit n=1 Tax=Deferribacter autotrophicus TaxID=500465 RepID=A0A5A8F197_9BACT|nr:heme lyase CcmF/NrfE family subunit [Deferribacter autotrophicus]KAA0257151.1 heme lyase CcmF/NrfE family subunit [Deferribacter autotrophicus]